MKSSILIGVLLVALGIVGLIYKGFSYESKETVAKIGPLEATAETTKDVPVPKILSIISIVAGAGLLITGLKK